MPTLPCSRMGLVLSPGESLGSWNRRIGGISMSFLCWEPCGWRRGLLILFAFLRCLSLSKVDLLGRYVRRRRRVQDDAFIGGRPSPTVFSFDGALTKESSLAGVEVSGVERDVAWRIILR